MLETPEKIRTLQRKLYCKAKQEPAFRFYALYDKIYRRDILQHAYNLVRQNKGAPGIDGVSFAAIERGAGEAAFLAELEEALRSKTYNPEAVKRVRIPKPDGTTRPLGIPTIRDRVAQMAVKLVIEPIFEADFSDRSYGFRPQRKAHEAIDDISYALNHGQTTVIDADISKYFDTIEHHKLLKLVAERISDGELLRLVKLWLKAPVRDEAGRTIGEGKKNRRGTPQGGVISPLLANIYLNLLDRIWDRKELDQGLRARLVRYADDFVVLCAAGTQRPEAIVHQVLDALGLSLNETKTRVVDTKTESFDFLGFEIKMVVSQRTGNAYPQVQPARKSIRRIKDRVKHLTRRSMTPVQLDAIIETVNQSLRGWVGYFHYRNCSQVLSEVKTFSEQRLRIHLRNRHKLKYWSQGYARFPNRVLYERYGLYKMPTTAGWHKAHALR